MRGYFGIGIYEPKMEENVGTLLRSAQVFGASFVFTIGGKYKRQASDTGDMTKHVPLWQFNALDEFRKSLPMGSELVAIEGPATLLPAYNLVDYVHPRSAVYILGSESQGLPGELLISTDIDRIIIDTPLQISMNVAMAGTIVMYDRLSKLRGLTNKT